MKCIEVSHIYADQNWGIEQETSLKMGLALKDKYPNSRLSMLIDNYHAPEIYLDSKNNSYIDHVVFEKDLTLLANKVINKIPNELLVWQNFKKENKKTLFLKSGDSLVSIFSIQDNKITYTCALLSSIWHLSRAGYLTNPWFNEKCDLVSILPQKYEAVEKKVALILNIIEPKLKVELIFY